METKITTLLGKEEVADRIKEMAEDINRDYAGKEVHLICILKGSVFFTTELAKYINVPLTMDFMSVSSYGNGTESSGRVRIVKDLDEGIEGKDVLLIEDIIDSGNTLSFLQDMLRTKKPASLKLWTKKPNSLKLCTLLDKPDRRVVEGIKVDYVGFEIPDEFVVGYGLDYMQKYRNLPYIGVVHLD